MIRANNQGNIPFFEQQIHDSGTEDGIKLSEQDPGYSGFAHVSRQQTQQTFTFGQGGGMHSSSSSQPDQNGHRRTRQERRKRADTGDRDFVCGCGKDYLSYAALYTHSKINHGCIFQDGTKVRMVKLGYQIILTGNQQAISSVGGIDSYIGERSQLDPTKYDPKNTSGTGTGIYSATMVRKNQELASKKGKSEDDEVYHDSASEDKFDGGASTSSGLILGQHSMNAHSRNNTMSNQPGMSSFKIGSSSSMAGFNQNQAVHRSGHNHSGASSSSHASKAPILQSKSTRTISVRNQSGSNSNQLAAMNQQYLKHFGGDQQAAASTTKVEQDLFSGSSFGPGGNKGQFLGLTQTQNSIDAQNLIKEKHYEFFEMGFKEYLHDLSFFLDNFNLSQMEDLESQLKTSGWSNGGAKAASQDSLFDPSKPDIQECFPQNWFLKAETWTPVFMSMMSLKHRLKNSTETTNNRKYFEVLTDPKLTCTQALTLFLMMNYNYVSIQFFKEMALVVCILRCCLDKHGPGIYEKVYKKTYTEKGSFCDQQNANLVPEFCDRFVKEAFQKFLLDAEQFEHLGFLMNIGIDPFRHTRLVMLVQYIGMWLHRMNLTDFELQLAKERENMFKNAAL